MTAIDSLPTITCPTWCETGEKHLTHLMGGGEFWHEHPIAQLARASVSVDQQAAMDGQLVEAKPMVSVLDVDAEFSSRDARALGEALILAAAMLDEINREQA